MYQPGRRFMLEQLGGRLSADGDGNAITLVIKNLEVTNSGGQS